MRVLHRLEAALPLAKVEGVLNTEDLGYGGPRYVVDAEITDSRQL